LIRRLLFFAGAVLFFASAPAFADGFDQTVQFTNSTGAVTNEGFSISPYAGTLNGQAVDFFCVDFLHNFGVSQGQTTTWNAMGTPLTNGSFFAGTLQYALNGNSTSTAYNNYLEMAWLITQLQNDLNQGDLNAATNDQLAIWTFSGYVNNNPLNEAAVNALLAEAGLAVQNNFTVTGWEVVTPDYANFPNSQEMIVIATPEPGTLLLLVAGAFGGLIVVFRRIA
jgi:hypothetical protein